MDVRRDVVNSIAATEREQNFDVELPPAAAKRVRAIQRSLAIVQKLVSNIKAAAAKIKQTIALVPDGLVMDDVVYDKEDIIANTEPSNVVDRIKHWAEVASQCATPAAEILPVEMRAE